jgi:transposase
MKRTELLQEIRTMRFEEAFSIWTEGGITQEEAARMLGVSDRSLRPYINRYHENGLEGLLDKRLTQASARKAPVDEVMALVDRFKGRYDG